jgi:hypothetical protein
MQKAGKLDKLCKTLLEVFLKFIPFLDAGQLFDRLTDNKNSICSSCEGIFLFTSDKLFSPGFSRFLGDLIKKLKEKMCKRH